MKPTKTPPETLKKTPSKTHLNPRLKIGVLGCANIAKQFVRDVQADPRSHSVVEFVAAASRDANKAQAFAQQFNIKAAYGCYDALLADPSVGAIYLPLPNNMHAQWAIAAAQAGKHILCEKPLALSLAQAISMFDAARANGVALLEAYPWWFQPQTRQLLDALAQIGTVRTVQASFGFPVSAHSADGGVNIRLQPDLGGGALLDAGSYCLSMIRLVMGSRATRVVAQTQKHASGVDESTMALLEFAGADGSVKTAQLSCAMHTANHRRAVITGSHGIVETEFINHTGNGSAAQSGYISSQLRVRRGTANTIAFEEIKPTGTGSGFAFAAQAFADMVAALQSNDTVKSANARANLDRAEAASLDIAAMLEAIAMSSKTGAAVRTK